MAFSKAQMGGSGLRQKPPADRVFSVRGSYRHERSERQVRRDTMLDLFRRGEVLSEGRTYEEEVKLLAVSSLMNIPHDGGRCGFGRW